MNGTESWVGDFQINTGEYTLSELSELLDELASATSVVQKEYDRRKELPDPDSDDAREPVEEVDCHDEQ